MNVLDKHYIKRMDTKIKEGIRYKNAPIPFKKFKQEINKAYGVFFINYIKTKDSNIYTVMIKRKEFTYIYSLDITTNELTLKGERKNANA